ncbi:MAG: relaxase/mobilization nuclease domain-containing protein [Longicatena sp.]|uniref:relaxase/mobilization nuclease domain-containing protein n=1 Tax=Anaerorhabdus sp. TaxID=1872524 RepID=UPI002FCCAE86
MPVVEYIRESKQNEAAVGSVLQYCTQKEKSMHVGRHLVTGINCNPDTAQQEFKRTRQLHGKDSGVRFYMTIQSFEKGVQLTPFEVHDIGCKLAREFYPNFEVVVSTHTDREHLHNHFVINSVDIETGLKLHQNKHTLQELRKCSDNIALQYGIEPTQVIRKEKGLSPREYRIAEKGKSWKFQLMNTIDECMKGTANKTEFISKMNKKGYGVKYIDHYKNITYTCPNGMKCRDNKLHDKKYLKEVLDFEFEFRRIEKEEHNRDTDDHRANQRVLTTDQASARGYTLRSRTEQERYQQLIEEHLGLSSEELSMLWRAERTVRFDEKVHEDFDYRGTSEWSSIEGGLYNRETRESSGEYEEANREFTQGYSLYRTNQIQENNAMGVGLAIGAISGIVDVDSQPDDNAVINKRKYRGEHERKNKYKQKMKGQEM